METIKPKITAKGFRTAVKDYSEQSVVEELAANSYDENATTVMVILDSKSNSLYIIDDGIGFNESSIREVTTLGGGDKTSRPYASGQRVYLGSYGYGLKSTLNISTKVEIQSASDEGLFKATIDWATLDHAFEPSFPGYPFSKDAKPKNWGTGSIIKLSLKNPTDKIHLEEFAKVLSNLPNDGGKFKCFYGFYSDVNGEIADFTNNYSDLRTIAEQLYQSHKLKLAAESFESELTDCQIEELQDKDDKSVHAKIYFAGIQGEKVKSLKSALRGVYIRVHGRLLKHDFSEEKYVGPISKYSMFKYGMRAELSVDWLRDQISLSRDGIKFTNEKLEKDFKQLLQRLIGRFIKPNLEKIKKKRAKVGDSKLKQRLELAQKRANNNQGILIKGLNGGFVFKPETDAELAILLAQSDVMSKVDKNFKLIDYNDQAPFDCMIYNKANMEFIYAELEPTLIEFLAHKTKDDIELIIVWTLGKWRMGAKKKGLKGYFELIQNSNGKKGNYKLLEYATEISKKPREDYQVIALDELF